MDGGECSDSCPGYLTPREDPSVPTGLGDQQVPEPVWGNTEKRTIFPLLMLTPSVLNHPVHIRANKQLSCSGSVCYVSDSNVA